MSNTAPACTPFEADLSALLDGELAPGRAAAVRAHVDGCAACSERYRQLCLVDLALAELPVAAVPADLRARLDGRIAGDAPKLAAAARRRRPGAAPRQRRGLSRRWLAAGLSAAAAVALYVAVNRGDGTPGDDRGRAPSPVAVVEPSPVVPREDPIVAEAPVPVPPTATEQAVARTATGDPEATSDVVAPVATAGDLADLSDEELAVVLELETIEDLDLIANLELLERMMVFEGEARG